MVIINNHYYQYQDAYGDRTEVETYGDLLNACRRIIKAVLFKFYFQVMAGGISNGIRELQLLAQYRRRAHRPADRATAFSRAPRIIHWSRLDNKVGFVLHLIDLEKYRKLR